MALVEKHRRRLLKRAWFFTLGQPVASLLWLGFTVAAFFFDSLLGFISLFIGGGLCVAISSRIDSGRGERDVDATKIEIIDAIFKSIQKRAEPDKEVWIEAELFPYFLSKKIEKDGCFRAYAHNWFSARWSMSAGCDFELYLTKNVAYPKAAFTESSHQTELRLILRAQDKPIHAKLIICPPGWELVDRQSDANKHEFTLVGEGEPSADNLLAAVISGLDAVLAEATRL